MKETHVKSRAEIEKRTSKSIANKTAITNRRIRVADLLLNHHSIRQIAVELDVAIGTIVADKKAIDAELAIVYAEEYVNRKERELQDLDKMEHSYDLKIEEALTDKDKLKWVNMKLKIKQIRAQWLGFGDASRDRVIMDQLNQDNRQTEITNVYIGNSGDPDAKPFVQELKERLVGPMPQLKEGITEGVTT